MTFVRIASPKRPIWFRADPLFPLNFTGASHSQPQTRSFQGLGGGRERRRSPIFIPSPSRRLWQWCFLLLLFLLLFTQKWSFLCWSVKNQGCKSGWSSAQGIEAVCSQHTLHVLRGDPTPGNEVVKYFYSSLIDTFICWDGNSPGIRLKHQIAITLKQWSLVFSGQDQGYYSFFFF